MNAHDDVHDEFDDRSFSYYDKIKNYLPFVLIVLPLVIISAESWFVGLLSISRKTTPPTTTAIIIEITIFVFVTLSVIRKHNDINTSYIIVRDVFARSYEQRKTFLYKIFYIQNCITFILSTVRASPRQKSVDYPRYNTYNI